MFRLCSRHNSTKHIRQIFTKCISLRIITRDINDLHYRHYLTSSYVISHDKIHTFHRCRSAEFALHESPVEPALRKGSYESMQHVNPVVLTLHVSSVVFLPQEFSTESERVPTESTTSFTCLCYFNTVFILGFFSLFSLSSCNLTSQCCESLSSALQSSNLITLDLSNNDLQDSAVKLLSDGLKSPNCQLQILSLSGCNLTGQCCESLSSALQSSNLIALDLSNNDLQDSAVKLLSDRLKTSNCLLKILSLAGCNLTVQCCENLSSALQSSNFSLRELDLSKNDLQDSGVKLLSDRLKYPTCQLQKLRLSGCMVTEEGCGFVSSALSSNPSHLRELDLSYNHPGDSGVKLLYDKLKDPNCSLQKLNVDHGGEIRITAGPQKYACDLTLDPNTAHTRLLLSEENRKVKLVEEDQSYPDHPERFDEYLQVLCGKSLTGRCYWEAEWIGLAEISVTYKGISRKGRSDDCVFGFNDKSWSLFCYNDRFSVRHNNNSTVISVVRSSNRVGVYVDFSAGTLSFYSVSDTHTLTHLHTLNTTFTEPLYAGFRLYSDSSVSLCQIKQDTHPHTLVNLLSNFHMHTV
ncbi:NACHT, LRR and PYD domains-containing protein 13-like [Rhinichthys klamathensis goyatoka]|uniref:NACHT, LRR and PYD domains-containing protein 13-like n=1 Tax=Rhinichthys klamathensis goyatoka TaxID=3034132 RepID=UPI0024B5C25F|nr:NACHT, LRR and PYD domains-containing protein 13-like [Rhinichthys klamathensis goyatoka]